MICVISFEAFSYAKYFHCSSRPFSTLLHILTRYGDAEGEPFLCESTFSFGDVYWTWQWRQNCDQNKRVTEICKQKKKEHTLPNYNWMQREKNGLDRKWACNFNLIRNTLESIDTENPSYMHTTWIVRYRVSEELRFPFHLFDSSFVSFRI